MLNLEPQVVAHNLGPLNKGTLLGKVLQLELVRKKRLAPVRVPLVQRQQRPVELFDLRLR